MGITDAVKAAITVATAAKNKDILAAMLEVQTGALELQEQLRTKEDTIRELKQEIRDLRDKEDLRSRMALDHHAYYMKDASGRLNKKEPYCQRCFDVDGIACHLEKKHEFGICHNCKQRYELEDHTPWACRRAVAGINRT